MRLSVVFTFFRDVRDLIAEEALRDGGDADRQLQGGAGVVKERNIAAPASQSRPAPLPGRFKSRKFGGRRRAREAVLDTLEAAGQKRGRRCGGSQGGGENGGGTEGGEGSGAAKQRKTAASSLDEQGGEGGDFPLFEISISELECHDEISRIIENKGKTTSINNILQSIEKTIRTCNLKKYPFFYGSIASVFCLCAEKSTEERHKIQYCSLAIENIYRREKYSIGRTDTARTCHNLARTCNNLYYIFNTLFPIYFRTENFEEMEKCWNNVPDYIRNNFADEDTTYILYYIGCMYMKLTKYAMS